jgi:uncharacterized membrane protein YfcA
VDPVVLVLAVLVGVTLGLLGGGGSILMVPLLVYVAGVDAKAAIATSLLVVGATSLAASVPHARRGRVRWRTAGLFGTAGMAGAYLGGRLGTLLPGTWLLLAFAAMMVVTAGAMLRDGAEPEPGDQSVVKILGEGLVVGVLTGLVGAGGGFLVVPALVLFGGLRMREAVGTSLVVIAMKSGAGVLGYLAGVQLDWSLAAQVTAAAVVGAVLGARFVDRIPADRLRAGFGWFVLTMAGVVVAREAPGAVLRSPVTWGVAVLVGLAVLLWVRRGGSDDADGSAVTDNDVEPAVDRRDAVPDR